MNREELRYLERVRSVLALKETLLEARYSRALELATQTDMELNSLRSGMHPLFRGRSDLVCDDYYRSILIRSRQAQSSLVHVQFERGKCQAQSSVLRNRLISARAEYIRWEQEMGLFELIGRSVNL